jgi:hypothetical protein
MVREFLSLFNLFGGASLDVIWLYIASLTIGIGGWAVSRIKSGETRSDSVNMKLDGM